MVIPGCRFIMDKIKSVKLTLEKVLKNHHSGRRAAQTKKGKKEKVEREGPQERPWQRRWPRPWWRLWRKKRWWSRWRGWWRLLRNGGCLDDIFVASFWVFMSLTCPFMTESEYLYQKRQVHLSLLNLTNDSKQTSVDGSGAGSCIGKTFVFDDVGPVPDRRHDDHFNSDHFNSDHQPNSDYHHRYDHHQSIPQSIHVCHAKANKLKQNPRDFRTKSGKRRTRRCDADQSRVLFLSDHPRVTTKSDRERHAEAATQAVEARKPRVGIVQHNILFHNINGQWPSRCATNPIWLNFIKRRCIDHAIIAETKMKTTTLKTLRGIPGYKMQAHPTQKIEKAALSNGMINLISTTSCRDTYGLRTDITNKYLFKNINNKLRLITSECMCPRSIHAILRLFIHTVSRSSTPSFAISMCWWMQL